MALVVKDRVQETTTTTGTGTLTLAGAVSGFQSFSVIGNGNTTYYSITGGAEWEIGIGTYTASGTTLSRDTVLESSNSGSLVNFSAGSKTVFCTYPAERSMYVDGTTITPATTATLPITSGGTGSSTATFSGANITSLNASSVSSGTLGATYGGTGQASLTANNVILGNGTSAVQFVAPGTSSNVLTSNGTTWISQAPTVAGGDFELVASADFASGSTECDVTNIPTTSGFYLLYYRVDMNNQTTNAGLSLRCSTDNGASFYSSAGNYLATAPVTSISIAAAGATAGAYYGHMQGYIFIYQPPNTANVYWGCNGQSIYAQIDTTSGVGGYGTTSGFGSLMASTAPVNAIKLFRTSGSKTYSGGYIRVYKLALS